MIDACKRASARSVTAVLPYFGYARADRKTQGRESIAAKLTANLITQAGADRVLAMDLHSGQCVGYFDIPVDHVYGDSVRRRGRRREGAARARTAPVSNLATFTPPPPPQVLLDYLASKRISCGDLVVVSPDVGGVARARAFAKKLNDAPLAIVDKRRSAHNVSEVMNVIGDVRGKVAVLVDDMIDTAGMGDEGGPAAEGWGRGRGSPRRLPLPRHHHQRRPLPARGRRARGVRLLHARRPVAAGHGAALVGRLPRGARREGGEAAHTATATLAPNPTNPHPTPTPQVIVTNTIPVAADAAFPELTVLSVANLLGETIWRVYNSSSVTSLF